MKDAYSNALGSVLCRWNSEKISVCEAICLTCFWKNFFVCFQRCVWSATLNCCTHSGATKTCFSSIKILASHHQKLTNV